MFIFINDEDQKFNFFVNIIIILLRNVNATFELNLIIKITLLILDFKTYISIVILFYKLIFLSFFIDLKRLIFNETLVIFVETIIKQQCILYLKNLIKILNDINNYNVIKSINFNK